MTKNEKDFKAIVFHVRNSNFFFKYKLNPFDVRATNNPMIFQQNYASKILLQCLVSSLDQSTELNIALTTNANIQLGGHSFNSIY